MSRELTNLEIRALNFKVGEKVKEFLVCAVCKGNPGIEYGNIDNVKFCGDKDFAKEKKKKLKKKFSKDNVSILEIQVRKIE